MPRGRYPRPPSAVQVTIGQALADLAISHRTVPYALLFDYLADYRPQSTLRNAVAGKLMRKALPPGCRMTATHFEFS